MRTQVVLLDERVVEQSDAGLSVEQILPGVLSVGCQRGRHGDASDDHVRQTVPPLSAREPSVRPDPSPDQYRPNASATLWAAEPE